jgi:hypothetical protein
VSILVTIGLLVLPVIALQRAGVDFKWVGAYGVVISAITYWVYARDLGLPSPIRATVFGVRPAA